jgi:ATP-dependent helicase/nuclease subunit A
VHGAKGLEAPIVFLPDTCSTRSGSPPGSLLKTPDAVRFLWPVRGTGRVRAIENARQEQQQAEREERDRLLYVALTRARDRLYVAGFEGAQAPPSDCWYNLVREGLAECLTQATDRTGRPVWRLQSRQTAPHETARAHAKAEAAAVSLPAWIDRPAAPEPGPGIRLRPSRLAPLEADDSVAPRAPPVRAEPALASPRMLLEDYRFLRGTLTHALLEHLPGVAPRHRQAAAEAFLASRAPKLAREVQADIVAETLAVLRHPDFAALFGPDSRAEVPIVALLPRPGGGPPLSLTGKIDRLVETHDGVMIVDYKTNRPPPHDVKEVAEAYLLQLAAYRLAVADIFPGVAVRAALLWTDGPRIMEIPRVVLDEHATRLWTLDPARLDA